MCGWHDSCIPGLSCIRDYAMTQISQPSEPARTRAAAPDATPAGNRYVLSLAALHREAEAGLVVIESAASAWTARHGPPRSGADSTPLCSWDFVQPAGQYLGSCRFLLREGVHEIGRAAECSLRLDCPGISRRHVRIQVLPTRGVLVRDLGSTNGTRVDGELIVEAAVDGLVVLDLGPLRMLLRPDGEP